MTVDTEQIARNAVVTPLMIYLYERDRSVAITQPSRLLSYVSARMFSVLFKNAMILAVNLQIDELTEWADDIEKKRQVLPQLLQLESLLDNIMEEGENG